MALTTNEKYIVSVYGPYLSNCRERVAVTFLAALASMTEAKRDELADMLRADDSTSTIVAGVSFVRDNSVFARQTQNA